MAGAIRGVAEGADAHTLTAGTWLAGALGLALALGLWAVYFDSVIGRPIRRSPYWILGWGYLHLPLMMALTAIGAGLALGVTLLAPWLGLPALLALLLAVCAGQIAYTLSLRLRAEPSAGGPK